MAYKIFDFDIASKIAILGGIITYAGIFTAIFLSQSWFTWFNNALSDLGVHDAAIVFNTSLFIGGISTAIFGIAYILKKRGQIFPMLAGIDIFLQGIFLFCIGLFVENTYWGTINLHYTVSVIFFVLIPFSMWFMSIDWILKPELRKFVIAPLILSAFTPALWLGIKWNGVAIPEFITSLTFLIWILILILMECNNNSVNGTYDVEIA